MNRGRVISLAWGIAVVIFAWACKAAISGPEYGFLRFMGWLSISILAAIVIAVIVYELYTDL